MNLLSNLVNLLALEQLEVNLFRGTSPQVGWQRVYGGLVISQALAAATRTVEPDRRVHSLHGYFLLAGDPNKPIIYEVDRIRDGKSFTTRRVKAIQHGAAIFAMSASFHIDEPGLEHQVKMPDVPTPEELPNLAALKEQFLKFLPTGIREYWERERPIDVLPVDLSRYRERKPAEPKQCVWIRAAGTLPDDPRVHEAVLAYASDMTLLDSAMIAHGKTIFDPDIMPASLDHAMWFHRPFRADEWLLYAQDSPSSQGARGLSRGMIFNRKGELICTLAQEGLIRQKRPKQ